MVGVDKKLVNKVVYDMSKNSRHYKNAKRLDAASDRCVPRPCINECMNEVWLTRARPAGVSKRCCRLQSVRSIHSLLLYVQGAHSSCRHAQLQLNVVGITMPTG